MLSTRRPHGGIISSTYSRSRRWRRRRRRRSSKASSSFAWWAISCHQLKAENDGIFDEQFFAKKRADLYRGGLLCSNILLVKIFIFFPKSWLTYHVEFMRQNDFYFGKSRGSLKWNCWLLFSCRIFLPLDFTYIGPSFVFA